MCLGSAWLLLIYRSHVEGRVRDREVWLDGEGVGQGRRPDFQGRSYIFINIFCKRINLEYICGLLYSHTIDK